jgi:hypothetical protein
MTEPDDVVADELMSTLRTLGAEPRLFEFTDEDRERGERDLARIVSTPPAGRRTAWIGRWPVRIGLATAAAAVLALVLIIIAPGTGPDVATARTPPLLTFQYAPSDANLGSGKPAGAVLEALANSAAAQGTPEALDVQYIAKEGWVLSTEDSDSPTGGTSVLSAVSIRQYFLADGKMRVIERRGSPLDASGRVKEVTDDGSRTISDETFDGPEGGPDQPARLPTDPELLARELVPKGACDGLQTFCLAERFTSLSYTYVLPGGLRAALWRTLKDDPKVSYLGTTRDRLDRSAVALSLPGADKNYRLLLFADAQTGALLGSETVLIRDSTELGLSAPAVTEFTAIVEARYIEADEVPPKSDEE